MHPTLTNLSAILRDPTKWPADFTWDYGACSQCAMGLTARLWDGVYPYPMDMAQLFQIPREVVAAIFMAAPGNCKEMDAIHKWRQRVTPERVADAIDAYVEGRK